jgi:hypothetical protein
MSNDIYHEETYTHKNGKKYHVCWYHDYDYGSPLENGDGYGETVRMDWNPTNEEQLEQHIADNEDEDEEGEGIELEEHTRLTMMRQLSRPYNRYDSGLYYDVLSSLHKAREEGWGMGAKWKAANPDATREQELMAAVDADFKHLKGWYDDDWHWLTVGVAPLDEDDEPMEDDREYCGGYESTILDDDEDNRAYKREAIENKIHDIEWALKKELHKNQLELDLCPT